MKRLLGGHPDLLDGFNCFLPEVRVALETPSAALSFTSRARSSGDPSDVDDCAVSEPRATLRVSEPARGSHI